MASVSYDLTLSGDLYNSTAGGYQIGGDYNREARGSKTLPNTYSTYNIGGDADHPFTFDIYCSTGAPARWDSSYVIHVNVNGDSVDLTNAVPYESLGSDKYRYKLYDIGTLNAGSTFSISMECDGYGKYPISQYQRPAYLVKATINAVAASSDHPYLKYNGNILKRMTFTPVSVTPSTVGTYYRYGDPTKWQSPDLLYRVTLPADYQAGVQYYSATEYPLWKK